MLNALLGAIGLQRKSLANPTPDMFTYLGAVSSVSGVSVTAQSAMRCGPVQRAVLAIAEPLGSMSLHVYRRDADGNKERDDTHEAQKLLSGQVNPWTSAGDLRQQLAVDCMLHGDAFAYVVRDGGGKPREIHRLHPQAVSVDLTNLEPVFTVTEAQAQRVVPLEDLIHIRAPVSFDGVTGEAPIHLARDAIGLAIVLERHGAKFFSNGANPKGVITNPKAVGPDGKAKIAAGWDNQTSGDNSGKTAVLDEGMKWQQVTMSSADAQFLELRRFQIEEIARCFGVPPHLLYGLEKTTVGNSEEMANSFLQFSLMPWLERVQNAFARALLTEEEREEYFLEYLVDDLARADLAKRFTAYGIARSHGWLSGNDIRRLENQPRVDGLDTYDSPHTTPGKPANDNEKEPAGNGTAVPRDKATG